MQNFKFLSSKELKPILLYVKNQWGFDGCLDYAFLLTEKERLYAINRAVDLLDLSRLRVNSLGLYFGEWRNDELRLSIEGSQIVGPSAKKNIVELSLAERKQWLQGIDIDKECSSQGFVLIKCNDDFLGCGKYKDGKILNFVPKARRLMNSDWISE